jgi:hypothetical protein
MTRSDLPPVLDCVTAGVTHAVSAVQSVCKALELRALIIPGLLQTEDYAGPAAEPRQTMFSSESAFAVVIDEFVLHRRGGAGR